MRDLKDNEQTIYDELIGKINKNVPGNYRQIEMIKLVDDLVEAIITNEDILDTEDRSC